MGYSDEAILGAFVTRLDDLLASPSPMRLTLLLSLCRHMRINHTLAVSPILSCLPDHYHNFSKELPELLLSLAALHQHQPRHIDALATQTCLQQDYLKKSIYRAFESFSRHGYQHSELQALAANTIRTEAHLSFGDIARLLAGFIKLGMRGEEQEARQRLRQAAAKRLVPADLYLLSKLRLPLSEILQLFAEEIELKIRTKEEHPQLAMQLLALAQLGYEDKQLMVALCSRLDLSCLPSSHLSTLLYTLALFAAGPQHVVFGPQAEGLTGWVASPKQPRASFLTQGGFDTIALVNRILQHLYTCYRQLNNSTQRLRLWNAIHYFEQKQNLTKNDLSHRSSWLLSEVKRLPPLPLLPNISQAVDLKNFDVHQICGHSLLCPVQVSRKNSGHPSEESHTESDPLSTTDVAHLYVSADEDCFTIAGNCQPDSLIPQHFDRHSERTGSITLTPECVVRGQILQATMTPVQTPSSNGGALHVFHEKAGCTQKPFPLNNVFC